MKCDKSAILGLIIIIGFFIILSVVLIKNEKIFNRIFNNKNIEGNTGSKETKDYVNGKALIDATRRGATIKSRPTKSQMFDGDVSKGGDSPLEVEQVVEDKITRSQELIRCLKCNKMIKAKTLKYSHKNTCSGEGKKIKKGSEARGKGV